MPKKAGRPPGAQNKVGQEQKEFIKGLLGETQEQFRKAFVELANSTDKGKQARFVNLSIEMSKMIVPKPIEADIKTNESNFQYLIGICSAWEDDL